MTRHSFSILLCLSLLATWTVSAAQAGSVTVTPMKDNCLFEESASSSNGAGEYFFTGQTLNGDRRRATIAFDLTTAGIPYGAEVESVTLTLEMSKTIVGSTDVSLHRLVADWGEGTSDAEDEEGMGAAATTGDATWEHTFFDTDLWATAGGDFEPMPSATTAVAGLDPYIWGSTPEMVADVELWLEQPATSLGWLVIGDETSTPPTAKRFNSVQNSDGATVPRLSILFNPPLFADNFESGGAGNWSSTVP